MKLLTTKGLTLITTFDWLVSFNKISFTFEEKKFLLVLLENGD